MISVALDFGTTYSGYAYSTSDDFQKDPTKIYSNDSWPVGGQGFSSKTPTCLLLTRPRTFTPLDTRLRRSMQIFALTIKMKAGFSSGDLKCSCMAKR